MEIVCKNCQKKLHVPENKIPKDRVAYLKCPKCLNRVAVGGPSSENEPNEERSPFTLQELTSSTYDASEKPFDFIEEETKTSIVCVADNNIEKAVSADLASVDFHITSSDNAREALKKMRYHTFDLVVLDELFDCASPNANGVLIFLQHLPMAIRRNIFVAMISENHYTMDNMQAFNKSVNLIVNRKNVGDFKKILLKAIAEHDMFYRVYRLSAKRMTSI